MFAAAQHQIAARESPPKKKLIPKELLDLICSPLARVP